MGRKYELKVKRFESLYNETKEVEVELFTWEKLNRTEALRAAFGLSWQSESETSDSMVKVKRVTLRVARFDD